MDSQLIMAFAALFTVVLALLIDALQTRAIRTINQRFQDEAKAFEERGTIGEQFGDWLLTPSDDKQGSASNLEVMTTLVGRQIAGSFSAAAKGIVSGDVRTFRSVEKSMLEGLQTPESKALIEACDRFGIPRELGGVLLEAAQKHGLLPQLLKNDGQSGGGQTTSW